jgi:hypothetical protein
MLLRIAPTILLGLALLGVVRAPTQAEAAQKPCVGFDLSYGLRTATPGTIFDFQQRLENCSDRRLTIRVRIAASGPCPFTKFGSARYILDADSGFFATGIFIGPSCPGRYRVAGRAIVRGVVVARAQAGFTVLTR